MKKFIPVLTALLFTFSLSAQYKKASFFDKEGRTYEFGSRIYMMGGGRGNPIGYSIGFGRDRAGKQFFSAWEIQIIPSYKYAYTTVDENNAPIQKNGSTKSLWIYSPNYGYHLLKNEEGKVVQPYVLAGLHVLVSGGVKEETETQGYGYPQRNTSEQSISVGISGGLGCLVNFNSTFGLKIQGGYDHQFNMSADYWDDAIKPYFLFPSHSYASIALRLKVIKD